MTTSLNELYSRYQYLQTYQDSSSELIKDLLQFAQNIQSTLREENRRLADELQDTHLDLDDAKKGRRGLQQEVQKLSDELQSSRQQHHMNLQSYIDENDKLKNRNAYILILIDGDGLLFHDDLVRDRNDGGKKAAALLRRAVSDIVGDRVNDLEIIARVVANVGGLSKAMVRDGCLDNTSDFKDFTLGFTQAKASFDFIDVGYGKERADTKIKETTRWHLQNHNCKQILLGISHDAGYAPFLDEILTDATAQQRISVLEGYPTVRELRDTKAHIVKFTNDMFRTTKLIDKSPTTISMPSPAAPSSVHGQLTPAASNASMSPPLSAATTVPSRASEAQTLTPTPTSAPLASTFSYANKVAAPSPPPQMIIPLAPKPSAKKASQAPPAPSWVPGPRGLDPSVQPVSQVAMENIKRRKEHNKLCNNHYLRGPCTKLDSCLFVHNYKPTKDEVQALALLSRLNPCTKGQECEVDDCIYGHHCPSFKEGVCGHPYCRFSVDAHPPGCKFKNSKIHDN